MKKHVFIDLDGTLLNSDTELSLETKEILRKLNNGDLEIVITTGRQKSFVVELLEGVYNLNYLISLNGAEVEDVNQNKILFSEVVNKATCEHFYHFANNKNLYIKFTSKGKTYYNNLKNANSEELYINDDNYKNFFENNDVSGFVVYIETHDEIKELFDEVAKFNDIAIINYTRSLIDETLVPDLSELTFVDISNKESNKGNALLKLCKYLNISPNDVIAIGDERNDIPMFKVAGHNVIVENAFDEIKEYAHEIIGSNNNSGVAKYLEKHFINN